MKHVFGSFRVLGRRAAETGRPMLAGWAAVGERASKEVSRDVTDKAYANECVELSLADQIRAMVADGKIDEAELKQLVAAPGKLTRCATRSHDITEIVKL